MNMDAAKKTLRGISMFSFFFLFAFLNFSVPENQVDDTSAGIALSVRVFDDHAFVDNLTLEDFDLYVDGQRKQIKALYLVKGPKIVSREEIRNFDPSVSRNFYLLFQMTDYDPKIAETIDHLFRNVLQPGDTLTIMTPQKPYSLAPQALLSRSKDSLSKEMQKILRKDIQTGESDYRGLLRDLRRLVSAISGGRSTFETDFETDMASAAFGLEFLLQRYKSSLQKMESLRMIDEKKLIDFARSIKGCGGQNFVFFFYQREFRPEISPAVLSQMMSIYQDNPQILNDLSDLFQFYRRDKSVEVGNLERAFADSSLHLNFIFMNREVQNLFGIYMREQSEDVFSLFSAAAESTGGLVDNTSANPAQAFKNAVEQVDNYYLLYHIPEKEERDGRFRKFDVRVKDKNYSVRHHLGFFAD